MNQRSQIQYDAENKINKAFLFLRVVVILAGFAWALLKPFDQQSRNLIYNAYLAFLLYSIFLYITLHFSPGKTRLMYLVTFLFDLVFISAMVKIEASANSSLFIAYILLVPIHSFYFGFKHSILIGIITAIFYSLSSLDINHLETADFFLRIGFIFVSAIGAGATSGVIKKGRDAIEAQNILLREKTEVIDNDLDTARKVQQQMLSNVLPPIPFINIATRYVPFGKVGGDYFEVVRLDNSYGFFMADVCGHGVPAALITAMLKVAFHSSCKQGDDTGNTLKSINSYLNNNMPLDCFVTAFYLVYDHEMETITYSSAGSPCGILYKKDEERCEILKAGGMPLGFIKNPDFEVKETALHYGDKLFIYTDGLTELRENSNLPAGVNKLVEFIEPLCAGFDIEHILERLFSSNDSGFMKNRKVSDDIAILSFEKTFSSTIVEQYISRDLDIPKVCDEIFDYLLRAGFASEDDLLKIILSLDEALNNAVIYGALELSSDKKNDDNWEQEKVERLKSQQYGSRKIDLTISLEGNKLSITVMDHGKGFDHENITDPGDGDNLLMSKGQGIALMKIFMDDITFNELGNEVTLCVTKESLRKLPLPAPKKGKKKKVLIIDDEPNIVSLLKRVLANSGYEVEESTDPLYGMVLIGEFKPDLLILDLRMPDVDGSEISRKLKESEATQHIKILIISGFLPAEPKHLIDLHADDFLVKPFRLNTLIERVKQLLA